MIPSKAESIFACNDDDGADDPLHLANAEEQLPSG